MSFTPDQVAYLQANRDSIEARRTFEVQFSSGTIRLIEGSTPWYDGVNTWLAAHGIISAPGIEINDDGVMSAAPAIYTFGRVSADLDLAHMSDEAEWRDRIVHQRLVLFLDGAAVGPALHIHRGRISDIRRVNNDTTDQFTITVEGPFQDRNATLLGKYTDRDQQMRSPGDIGCEYASQYEVSGAEFTGWLQL